MIKVIQFHESGKPNPSELLLAIDVSNRSLDIYGRYMQQAQEYEFSDSISNDLRSIAGMLDHYDRHTGVLGYTGLAIVLEPSGRHAWEYPFSRGVPKTNIFYQILDS